MKELKQRLKQILIQGLNLEEISVDDIDDSMPLFSEDGLGLDSLDAVEIAILLQKHFQIELKEDEEGKQALQSINSLAEYITKHKGQ
ncbi:acyl carrier protein [Desulfonauticus submarinus]|uniref:Acyl carrier protein n=1 Tax=Desulfonauticus submarinus TaxID=206665 RepID=A0A1H0FTL2_9BACT|nr:phosphopantetheine-binding protein [Desulfonauticus submarinus]SDN97975.1 acyl carrier protein [Desulfonauticus submarinus]